MRIVVLVALVACHDPPRAIADAAAPAVSSSTVTVASSVPPAPPPAPVTSAATLTTVDAGASACKLTYGPAPTPWKGPSVMVPTKAGVDVVFNDEGRPRVVSVDSSVKAVSGDASAAPSRAMNLACAAGGAYYFCPDRNGSIHRAPKAGGADTVVASSRNGTRIDATTIAGGKSVYAYLAMRKTSEGLVSEAWAAIDDATPVRISEDGSGATSIDLVPRGAGALAMMLDARQAQTPMHARTIAWSGGKIDLGADAVVFVGGNPERHTLGCLASDTGSGAWALLPIARDISTFGMATIRVDDPPRVDAPLTWSMYPNGCDPSPIAATQGRAAMRVARVRPAGAEVGSPKVLELGRLEAADGGFTSLGVIPTHGTVTDVAIEADAQGALWLAYTDGAGTWIERRNCP